jgi:3-hydroxybutyryl-CoA dehydrogenase
MEIRTVGVVGAGVMGRGVSQALAQTGHSVILLDVSQDILEHAKDEIRENVRLQSLFGKRDATQTPDVTQHRPRRRFWVASCSAPLVSS